MPPDRTAPAPAPQTADAEIAQANAAVTLGSLSPTQWQVNQSGYDGTISVSGGSGGYQNLQVSGLPSGLSASVVSSVVNGQQSGTITISGTPTQSGTFNLSISLDDGNGDTGSGTATLTITAVPINLGSLSPTQWQVNQSGYDGTISVSGGSGGYQNLQVSGLPSGLSASVVSSVVNGQHSGTITISGTPTQSGTFNLSISLDDGNGDTGNGAATLTITAPPINLGSLSPTQWQVNQSGYDGTISVSGGSGGYQNLQVSGLPSGLSASVVSSVVNGQQSGTITISGTPTQSGTFNLSISLDDGNGDTGSGTATLTITAAPINLGSLSPTQWEVNQSGYDGTISVTGGSGGYQNLQVSGLPSGLSASVVSSVVNSQQSGTITISGTPTQSGTFNLAVSLEDGNGGQASGTYTLTIDAGLTLGNLNPNEWTAYKPGYKGVIAVSGGSGSYSNAQVSGLPGGLSAALDGSDIDITGTPTQSGTFTLQVSIADSNGATATGTDSLTVNPAVLTFGPLTPGKWQVNQPGYDGVISISGGSGSYTNLQVSGLPAGLTPALAGSSIDVTGTPSTAGTFSIGLSVEDASGGASGTGTDTLTVTAGSELTLGNLAPTQWTVNHPGYSGSISVSGGSGRYSGLQVSGLPAGLSAALSGHAILVRGTPTQQGTFKNIAVTLQDSQGESGSGTYSMTINPAITLGDLDPTEWDVNQPGYDGTISVSGGTGGYSNLKVTGLPAGLTPSVLSSVVNVNGTPVLSGLISITGTPTKSGVFPLVVSLTDATGATNQSADAATAKAEARVVSLTGATGATGADKYQLTINPATVDLQVSVNGNRIVPKLATDLNLRFFFGMEQVNVPVTFGNGGPDVLKGTVMLNLYLSQNADGSGARIPLSSTPISVPLNLSAQATDPETYTVTVPSKAVMGTSYFVVASALVPSGMKDSNPNNNTGVSSQNYEFVGTPNTKYVQIFNHDSAANAILAKSPPFGYYAYVRATIIPDSYNFTSVLGNGQQFTELFEGLRLWPYLDSKNIPTLGYGINLSLGSIQSIAGLETALVNAVGSYVNNPSNTVNAQLKKLFVNGVASNPNAVIAELAREARANGSSTGKPQSRPGLDVMTGTSAASVFAIAYNVKAAAAQKAFTAFKPTGIDNQTTPWNQLTTGEQIALIDIQFNTKTGIAGFPALLSAIDNGDLVEAAFQLVNSQRTLDVGATRTLACLESLMTGYTASLGQIIPKS